MRESVSQKNAADVKADVCAAAERPMAKTRPGSSDGRASRLVPKAQVSQAPIFGSFFQRPFSSPPHFRLVSLLAMSSSTISKKRKRGADHAEKATFRLSDQPASQVGPVLGECLQFDPANSSSSAFQPAFRPCNPRRPPRFSAMGRGARIKTCLLSHNRL